MKTIAALAILNAALLVLGPLAYGGERAPQMEIQVAQAWTGGTFLEQNPYRPLLCLDSYPVVIAALGDFLHQHDDPECRPAERIFHRELEE